jgi:hypothetical protein
MLLFHLGHIWIVTLWSRILLIMWSLWAKLALQDSRFMLRYPEVGYHAVHIVLISHVAYLFSLIPGFFLADNWGDLVQRIKSKGMRPGVSLKPGTPIEEVYPLV